MKAAIQNTAYTGVGGQLFFAYFLFSHYVFFHASVKVIITLENSFLGKHQSQQLEYSGNDEAIHSCLD